MSDELNPARGICNGLAIAVFIWAGIAGVVVHSCEAKAEGDDSRWTRKSVRSSCDFWGNCTWRYTYPRRHYQAPVYAWRAPEPPRPSCLDRVGAVGEERQGRERAQEEAARKWANAVRYQSGVRYMDLQNAKHVSYECSQSSTGERTSEKLGAALGRDALMQCEVRAVPCRAEREGER